MSDPLEPRRDLAVLPTTAISMIIAADENGILADIAAKVAAFRPDISTSRGRDAMRSLAYDIAKAKASLVKIGKGLTEDWRTKTKAVNAECNIIEERMDELRDKVRAPLTAWENAEKDRVAGHEQALRDLDASTNVEPGASSDVIRATLRAFLDRPARNWQEFSDRAEADIKAGIQHLDGLLASALQREAEAAELARLRAAEAERQREQAERERREHEARIAAEAAEKARQETEAEAARLLAEERMKAAQAAEAAERARLEAEQRLIDERAQAARAAQAAEDARMEAVRRAAQAEAERLAAIERAERDRIAAAEKAEADRIAAAAQAEQNRKAAVAAEQKRAAEEMAAAAAEEAKRAVNKAHRSRVMGEAKVALIAHAEIDEDTARRVVIAISKGLVSNVVMGF